MRYSKFYFAVASVMAISLLVYSFVDRYSFGGSAGPERKVVKFRAGKIDTGASSAKDASGVGYPIYSPDFSLVNQDGVMVSSRDLVGKYLLVMFGFSSCKTVCPVQLANVAYALGKLGKLSERLRVIFITVDPDRDTVKKLKEFHSRSDPRVMMLTGDKGEIRRVADGYKVFVGQKDAGGQIPHSSIMYLMDPNLHYLTHFTTSLPGSSPGRSYSKKSDADEIADGLIEYISSQRSAGY